MASAPSSVVRSATGGSGIVFSWLFVAFVVTIVFIASRALGQRSDAWTQWLALAIWLVPIYFGALATYGTWRTLSHGTAALQLDDAMPRAGGWLSGVIEVTKLPLTSFSLHVECVKTSTDVDGSKNMRAILWQTIIVLDPERIKEADGRPVIPFAVFIPADAQPTSASDDLDVDWTLRIQAGSYVKQFEIPVHPAASSGGTESSSHPPRVTPAMSGNSLAELTTEGRRTTIDLPFPFISLSLALLLLALAISVGVNRAGASRAEMESAIVIIGAFLVLSAFMFLLVVMTPRRVTIEGDEVRIRRGVLGIGFHSRISRGDIVRVEEMLPVDPTATAFYRVMLQTRDGRSHDAAIRLKDPVRAKGIAAVLRSALHLPRESGHA